MKKRDIRERLAGEVLLADGAMGSLLVSRGAPPDSPRSPICLTTASLVREIHDDYIGAGAQILTTNTWDANRVKLARFDWADSLEKINRAAVRMAHEAAEGEYVYVAGDVGPLGELVKPYGTLTKAQVRELFAEQIRILLEERVDLLLFETFSSTLEAVEAVRAARELSAEVPILASMTFLADGKTPFGADAAEALQALHDAGADVVGMNSTIGPQESLEVFQRVVPYVPAPVSVMPTAGYPWLVAGRMVYPATPDYFRDLAREFVKGGVAVLGGCQGTGPEHVAAMAREVVGKPRRHVAHLEAAVPAEVPPQVAPGLETSALKRRLADPEAFVVTVEIEPPRGTDASAAVDGARLLKGFGVDGINVTDNPMARLRMSSIAVAHLVKKETGAEAVFHYSPRDRNVLGIQSDLLGAAGLGIKALLVVGGDPLKIGDYPQGKHVGEVDTLGLLRIVKGLNQGVDMAGGPIGSSTSFAIACAANPAAPGLDVEIQKLQAKVESGATFAQTQPVFDPAALDRFYARPESRLIPVLVGLVPLKSLKQALYFANEVPGMHVPETAIARMRAAAEKGPEFEREEGVLLAIELARAIAERARGLHLMPMARYDVVKRILAELPARGRAEGSPAGGGR
ncbi:MAG: bifunctional homocysteine S-methyltransferase/methylenetetrahydrofolate reductase [Acidobacteria bacterium]|nr:MAG: bifunctional homocysteine S-methyltransferase/methylenetetrahydrofolate reductase [Acidobacteriota bacterium]MCE7957723.1 bifunctional homocysteine S-methyltransferase/methylenetetrahydrofolate reductase [Acidobacteria bacterium ACB2]